MRRAGVLGGWGLAAFGCLCLATSILAVEEDTLTSDSAGPQLLEARLTNKVDILAHDVPLRRFVSDLAKRHRFEVRFDEKEIAAQSIPLDRPVSIAKEGVELKSILSRTLRNYGLEMRIDGQTLVIGCMKPQPVAVPGAKPKVEQQDIRHLERRSTVQVYLVQNDLGDETRRDWGYFFIDTRSLTDKSKKPDLVKRALRDWLPGSDLAAKLQKQLTDRIDADHAVCGLSEVDQEKLRLAGQREIQHYLAEVDRLCAKCAENYDPKGESIDIPADAYSELRSLEAARQRKMFGADSLFGKLHSRIVSPSQRKKLQVVATLREAGASVTTRRHPQVGVIEVHLSTRPVTDEILSNLSQLPELEAVSLDSTQITDEGLRQLDCLKELRWLDLSRSRIGDEAMNHVARLPCLERLELSGTLVTDTGLESLASLRKLKLIDVSKTNVTEAGAAKLRKSFSGIDVMH